MIGKFEVSISNTVKLCAEAAEATKRTAQIQRIRCMTKDGVNCVQN